MGIAHAVQCDELKVAIGRRQLFAGLSFGCQGGSR